MKLYLAEQIINEINAKALFKGVKGISKIKNVAKKIGSTAKRGAKEEMDTMKEVFKDFKETKKISPRTIATIFGTTANAATTTAMMNGAKHHGEKIALKDPEYRKIKQKKDELSATLNKLEQNLKELQSRKDLTSSDIKEINNLKKKINYNRKMLKSV